MTIDAMIDLAAKILLLNVLISLIVLTPLWAWFVFGLYLPKKGK